MCEKKLVDYCIKTRNKCGMIILNRVSGLKVKLSLCLTKHHAMKTLAGVEV
jgi:hypothetical protein